MTVKMILDEKVENVPEYQTPGAAAIDLVANIDKTLTLVPGSTVKIPTGLSLDMTEHPDLCALILPRSGLGSMGFGLANTVGLIDNDYQGEIIVMARNLNPAVVKHGVSVVAGAGSLTINPGERIAQLLFLGFERPALEQVDKFKTNTTRGKNGFGSTGK